MQTYKQPRRQLDKAECKREQTGRQTDQGGVRLKITKESRPPKTNYTSISNSLKVELAAAN